MLGCPGSLAVLRRPRSPQTREPPESGGCVDEYASLTPGTRAF